MDEKGEIIISGPKSPVNYSRKYNSFGQCILENLKTLENKECLVDAISKQSLTYTELLSKSIQTAESLKLIGVSRDDRVAICSENHVNYFVPLIASMCIGATVSPLNNNYTLGEFTHCLNITKPKIIFCSSSVLHKISELQKTLTYIKHIVCLDEFIRGATHVQTLQQFINSSEIVQNLNTYKANDVNSKEDVGFILYSSGTTGLPKAVMLTHYNLLTGLSVLDDPKFDTQQKSIIGILPFFHIFGLMSTYATLHRGGLVIILKRFEVELYLKTIQDYRISSLMLVPPIMVVLAKSPLVDRYDLSSVKNVICGAAPLSKDIEDLVKKRLRLQAIDQGYGLTEVATYIFKTPINSSKEGSVGVLVPNLKCKVLDLETGKTVGAHQRGELCYKGPVIMKGYFKDPQETSKIIDEEGWLHSGDVGYFDENENFYIVDRIKELIKYKGYQVAPAELEHLLLSNPCIKDAAVIGIPDKEAGELPMAFVVKEPKAKITGAEVQQFVQTMVSSQKHLRGGVLFVSEIPKSPSGKILRRKLREMIKRKSKL